MKRTAFWVIFFICACFLHFKNLGSTRLWQDEAETAVLARNTLRYGVPKVWDGKNGVSQNMGTDHDSHGIWNYSPWLGIYLAAGSFALLGESTFTARLPFVLCSLLTLLLLHKISRRWSSDKRTADLTVWLTLLSVPYLLHARQCRYYVLDALFALYLFYAYQSLLESRKNAGWHLCLSSFGLFHSNFLVFFSVLGGVATHFLLFVPHKTQILRRNAACIGLAVLLLLPGCFYFHVFNRAGGENPDLLAARWQNFRFCLRDVDYFIFPTPLLLLLPIAWKRFQKLKMPLSFLAGGLVFLMLAPHYFFRYLISYIPLCSFIIAEIFWMLYDRRKEPGAGLFPLAQSWRAISELGPGAGRSPLARFLATYWSRGLGIGLLTLLLFSHALSPSYWAGYGTFLKTDLADFLYETTHPIQEPVKAAADYLNLHASPGDLLLVSYPDLPFIFYTSLRVVGGREGRRAVTQEARWILLRNDSEKSNFALDFSRYEKIPLDAPNHPWTNGPDPDTHMFRTVKTPEPAAIYRLL